MAKMPLDSNSNSIPVLMPLSSEDISGVSSPMTTEVVRLVATTVATYNITGHTGVVGLPANIVEYIRVNIGDTITTNGEINITQMA